MHQRVLVKRCQWLGVKKLTKFIQLTHENAIQEEAKKLDSLENKNVKAYQRGLSITDKVRNMTHFRGVSTYAMHFKFV